MSINNLSSHSPAAAWWKENHSINPSSTVIMFEKPLTPSDVGKLNRLVIPKQYAEKYFPLRQKLAAGMLLCFEDDESGNLWRFRYSYWSSSQSYVLTKGWNRFVKEKNLQPGDVVFFHRHSLDSHRKLIGWRRRLIVASPLPQPAGNTSYTDHPAGRCRGTTVLYDAHSPYAAQPPQNLPSGGSVVPARQQIGNGNGNGSVRNKREFRLFGVNLSCQPQDLSDHSDQSASDHSSSFSSDI